MFLVRDLRDNPQRCPKFLVICRSVVVVANTYKFIARELSPEGEVAPDYSDETVFLPVAKLDSATDPAERDKILAGFKAGAYRGVISTALSGHGFDFEDLEILFDHGNAGLGTCICLLL